MRVDEGLNCIEMYAFLNENALVWTEDLNASKCMRFQTKTH